MKYLIVNILLTFILIANMEDDSLMLIYFSSMRNTYQEQNNWTKALKYQKKELDLLLKKSFSQEQLAKSYLDYSYILTKIGDYGLARVEVIKALKIYNSLQISKTNLLYSSAYTVLGEIYNNLAQYQKAKKYNKLALKILIKHNKFYKIGINYNNLSNIEYKLNNFIESKNLSLKAIETFNKIHQSKTIEIDSNNNITKDTYYILSNPKKFLDNMKVRGEFAIAYYNLSISSRKLKENNIENIMIALKLNKGIFEPDNPKIAFLYHELSLIYLAQDKINPAIKYLDKCLNISRKRLDSNHPIFIIYNDTSIKILKKGLKSYQEESILKKDIYRKIFSIQNESINIFQKNRKKNFDYFNNNEKFIYNIRYNLFNDFLKNSHLYNIKNKKQSQMTTKTALKNWLNYKGIVSEGINLLEMIYDKADKKTKKDIDKLRELSRQLSNLLHDTHKDNTKTIKYLEEESSQIQIKLNKNIEEFREFNNLKNISYLDISKTLKEDELYIDFAKTDDNYYIFTLDKSNNINFKQISEEESKKLEEKIQEFRVNNKSKATKSIKETQITLNEIYNILDLYINFKSKKSLIISPDGLLNFLPFEALYDGDKYLVENVNISYIPSGRELVRQSRRESKNNAQDIVVFTHPSYDLTDKKEYPKNYLSETKKWTKYLKPLEGSLEEAKAIKGLYPKAKIYQDDRATVENLFKIKSPKILHISTHGGFRKDINSSNPMQQTFLAFVDANLAPQKQNYKGIATALKLSSLELSNTQLVFLSACETGLGKINQAEGVQGLPKAFIQAGAKNVIMSLWQVNDSSTATLTKYFYESVKSGKGYKDALREAKIKMIDMHPYYWSAFILSGV